MTTHQELWTFIVTNLASVYIREGNRHQEVKNYFSRQCLNIYVLVFFKFDTELCFWVCLFFLFNQQLYSLLERINPDHNFPVR